MDPKRSEQKSEHTVADKTPNAPDLDQPVFAGGGDGTFDEGDEPEDRKRRGE